MFDRIRQVPSWPAASIGALTVTLSVALGPLCLYGLEDAVRDERGTLSELRESHQQAWSRHTIAYGRVAAADTMAASIEQAGADPDSFRLDRAGYHLEGAIRSMWASTGETDDSELTPQIEALRGRLNANDLSAYNDLASLLNRFRSGSADALSTKATQIVDSERRIHELEQRLRRTRRLQASMNVIGLTIVLLAGLPIWRKSAVPWPQGARGEP